MLDSGSKSVRATLVALAAALFVTLTPAIAADAPAPAANAVPATDATWKGIDAKLQQLEALIGAGKLDDLGSSAYGIANLVKTLPGQSASLPADKLAQVTSSVKVVGGLVSKVDKAGEAKDKAGVDTNLKSLKGALDSLRVIYFGPKAK
jgi:hypothetical protein